ncbi:SHOCT domain-containing protein [Marinimicrobium sp. ABcell2]|uniref:SHOCT domain-containing protein n=1 Tax=Marinimicrobium sp. ABcell2 TaxID=3069751 RepID=UPI0027ADD3AC|nr:SHOCT domain-containing protein [Marinimicrobium sp. ABcell2]MDQ2076825.1 SHOCT domain-containing protein [Marinimicrobium sp. ABcell2]
MNNKIKAASFLALSLTMAGCMYHGGTQETIHQPTLGQELLDLQSALDKGAISQQEYARKKERLIDGRTAPAADQKRKR